MIAIAAASSSTHGTILHRGASSIRDAEPQKMTSSEPERSVMIGDVPEQGASAKVRCLKCFGFFTSGEHACKSAEDQQTEYDAAEAAAVARLALAGEQSQAIAVVLQRGGGGGDNDDNDGAASLVALRFQSQAAGSASGGGAIATTTTEAAAAAMEEEDAEDDKVEVGEEDIAAVATAPAGKWRNECTICGKRFRRPYGLQRHSKVHRDDRPFSCPQCGLCVREQYRLREHIRTHTSEPEFKCTVCSKVYTRRDHLQRHARKVHEGVATTPTPAVKSAAKATPKKPAKKKKAHVNVKGGATKASTSQPGPAGATGAVAAADQSVDPFDFDSQNPPDQA